MSNLIAVAYPDEATASEGGTDPHRAPEGAFIQLDDLVVAIRRDNGKVKLKQASARVAAARPAARCGAASSA